MKTLVAPSCFQPLFPSAVRPAFFAAALFAALLAGTARAQTTITLVNSGNLNLNTAANWSSSSTPTATNILSWTSTVTGATTDTMSGPLSIAGLQLVSPGGAVTIANASTATLSLGASGIDLSAATQSLTLTGPVALSAAQTWTVASGQTLAVTNPGTISGAGKNLTIAGAGNVTINSVVGTGAGSLTMNGTGTLTLNGVNTFTGGTTINSGTVVPNPNAFGGALNAVVINGGTLDVGPVALDNLFSGGSAGTILITTSQVAQIGNSASPSGFNFLGTVNIGNAGVTLASSGTATVGALLMTNGTLISDAGLVLQAGGTFTDTAIVTSTTSGGVVDGTFVNSQVRTGTGPGPTFTPSYSNAVVQGPTTTGTTLTFSGPLLQGGSLLGNINIINTYNPDNNGAIVTANGSIALGSNAVTTLNLGGALPGQYDQIQIIGGTFTLNGALVLTTAGVTTTGSATGAPFFPVAGETFALFSPTPTVATLAGSFGSISLASATLSSNLLAWDTSKLASTGVVGVDLTNDFWTGTTSTGTSTDSWAGATGLGNFTTTDSAGSASQSNALQSFSNVFLTMTGAAKATTQSLGANFTINSLSFIQGGDTLTGTKAATQSLTSGDSLTLSAASSFQDQNGTNYPAGTGIVVQNGATAGSTINITVHLVLGSNQAWEINSTAGTLTVAGAITDDGNHFGLTKTGVGTLVLTSPNSSYSGGLTIAGGTVQMGFISGFNPGVLSTIISPLAITGGALDINGTNQTVSSVLINGGMITNSSSTTPSAALTSTGEITDITSSTSSLAAALAGAVGLDKTGPGTLNVLVNQLYTGVTSISAGILSFSSTGSFAAASAVNLTGGTLAGTGTAAGPVTVSSGATLNPGAVGGGAAGQLTLGSLSLQPGSILNFNLNPNGNTGGAAGTSYSTIAVTGLLTTSGLNSTNKVVVNINPVTGNLLDGPVSYTWTLIAPGSIVGSFPAADFALNTSAFAPNPFGTFALVPDTQNPNDLDLTYTSAIPEPSTVALIAGLGVLGVAALRRRRSLQSIFGHWSQKALSR